MRSPAIILAILALRPIAAHAQTAEPPPFRLDTATSIGWFTASHHESGNCCADWSSSLFKGVGGGYYWTDHLKSEIEIARPGTTRAFSYSDGRSINGPISYTYQEHAYRGVKISADHIAIGSTLTIRTTAGERLTGVLFVVDDTAITVKPKTRVPEPAQRVAFDRIEELTVRRDRVSIAKYVGVGAAVGAGVFVSMLAAAFR